MSYALGTWDQAVEGGRAQTYRLTLPGVQNLPSGSAPTVPGIVAGFLRDNGFTEQAIASWGAGGTLVLQYRAPRSSPAYGSGVVRRQLVERSLTQAAGALGPSVTFGPPNPAAPPTTPDSLDPEDSPDLFTKNTAWWILGGIVVVGISAAMFVAGTSVEDVRQRHVRANRRRRRRR